MATTGDETLLDEQRRATKAGAAGIAAGALTLAGGALATAVYGDLPSKGVLDALRERFASGDPPLSLDVMQVRWYDDHAPMLILIAVVLALAAAAIGVTLAHLYRAVKARRPEVPAGVVYAAIAGAVLVAVAGVAQAVGITLDAASFAGAKDQSSDAARDVLQSPVIVAAGLLRLVGVFALGLGFFFLALNAMRVGLLTRFMGVLGMIVGVLFIVPVGSSLPIVQSFWLAAIGLLFLGRWPAGRPPAWVTGEAQPWPTQQELREAKLARDAETGAVEERPRPRIGRRERAEPPETPAPEPPARRPHPSSKKRKRRRR